MNNRKIQADLKLLAKKHNLKLGIILFENNTADTEKSQRYYVGIFSHHNGVTDECELADLLLNCQDVSPALDDILGHASHHVIKKMLGDITLDIHKPSQTKKPN